MFKDDISEGDVLVWKADNGAKATIIVTGQTVRDGKDVYLIRLKEAFDAEPDAVDEKTLRTRCTRETA